MGALLSRTSGGGPWFRDLMANGLGFRVEGLGFGV